MRSSTAQAGAPLHRRRLTRGSVERVGPTWWNRYREERVEAASGEVRRVQARMRLGSSRELRTARAAAERLDAYLALLVAETLSPGTEVTVADYAARFGSVHVALMRPNSARAYLGALKRHILPTIGARRLDEIDAAAVQDLVAQLAPRLARSSVRFVRGVVLQLVRQAIADGFAAHRITAATVKLPKSVQVERERRHMTEAELEALLADERSPLAHRTLWAVLGYAGLRGGEALGLGWSHIDLERRVLRVRQACVDGRLAPPKTAGSVADVPLLPELERWLTAWRGAWTPNALGLVFASRRGRPLRADDVRRRWLRPALDRAGLPAAGLHAFRHGVPGRLNAMGLSPASIRLFMRHARLEETQRYLHHASEAAWREISAAQARSNPGTPPAEATSASHDRPTE